MFFSAFSAASAVKVLIKYKLSPQMYTDKGESYIREERQRREKSFFNYYFFFGLFRVLGVLRGLSLSFYFYSNCVAA
jgi:hypothetical protein